MACRSWIGTATYCMQSLGSAVVSDPRPFPRTSWLVKRESGLRIFVTYG